MMPGSPRELGQARPSVVRLNRRAIYVVGAVVIVAFVTGLIAVRAQGRRLTEANGERRIASVPRSQPWFDRVPDHEPPPHRAPDPLPSVPPAGSPKAPTTDEQESQRRQRVLRAAMSAPIGVTAFEKADADRRYRGDSEVGTKNSAEVVTAMHRAQGPRALGEALTARPSDAARQDTTPSGLPPEYLRATVRKPVSAYEVKAGTIIPAVMLTAINSDLPGQILGQVRENVYDTDTGEHLLIPQGTRLIGLYDHHVVYGQQRVLITWKRLVFPDGSSLSLNDGMPGTDGVGAAGAHDQVNHHYLRTFGNALLLSVISAGVQLSQVPDFGRGFAGPSAGNILGAAVGQQLGSVSAEFLRRGMSVAPTLEIRPGYPFNVMVTRDVIFPGAYEEASQR